MNHAKHFIRLLLLVSVVIVAFLGVRSMVVPKDFGKLGHFRAAAITEEAAREPRHLGNKECADCHSEITDSMAIGKHKSPKCEVCHGPGFIHVKVVGEDSVDAYPDRIKQNKNAVRVTSGIVECQWCHVKTFERPDSLKSIRNVKEHFAKYKQKWTPDAKCIDCHNPHTTVVK